jgi:hypothetical protein
MYLWQWSANSAIDLFTMREKNRCARAASIAHELQVSTASGSKVVDRATELFLHPTLRASHLGLAICCRPIVPC